MTHANRLPLATTVAPVLALLLCTSMPAAAQTVITEPSQGQSTTVERTIIRERAVPASRAAKNDRRVTTTRTAPRKAVRSNSPSAGRTTTHERIVTTSAPVRERIVAPATRTIVTGGPLDLSPAERAAVYRTLVGRPAPRIVVTDPAPRAPVVTQRIVTGPAYTRPLVTAVPDDDDIDVVADMPPVSRGIVSVPETTGAAIPAERVELVVGSRVPRSVPLYDIPASAAAAAPAIGQYRYALMDDRVYLVDPADSVIVAELYR